MLSIQDSILEKIKIGDTFPLQFSSQSPVYLAKIIQLNLKSDQNVDCIRCQMFIRKIEYRKIPYKCIIGETQLLLSSKVLNIHLNLFISLVICTQYNYWDESIQINTFNNVKNCNIELMTPLEYANFSAYKKACEINVPFRRLPNGLSLPRCGDLNSSYFTNDMTVKDLIKTEHIIGFTKNYFNLNSSLSYVRIPSNINGIIKMEEDNEENKLNINPVSTRKHRKKRRKFNFRNDAQISNNPDNTNQTVQEAELLQEPVDARNNDDDSNLASRNLRRRAMDNLVGKTQKEPRPFRNARSKKYKYDSDENEKQSEKEKQNENNEVLRRSTRKQNITIPNEEGENPSPENESNAEHLSDTNSIEAKKLSPAAAFRKKSREILQRWDEERDFNKEFHEYFQSIHNHIPRTPKMGWMEVNFYKLFKNTIQRGGFLEVTRKLLWKDIYKTLNSTTVVSNAATTIRSHYKRFLFDFEQRLFSESQTQTMPPNNPYDENKQLRNMEHNGMDLINKNDQSQVETRNPKKEFLIDNILNNTEPGGSPHSYHGPVTYNTGMETYYDHKMEDGRQKINHHQHSYDQGHYYPPRHILDSYRPYNYPYSHGPNYHSVERPPYPQYHPENHMRPCRPFPWEGEQRRPYNNFYCYPPGSMNSHSMYPPHHHPSIPPPPPPPYDHPYPYGYDSYSPHFINHYPQRFPPYPYPPPESLPYQHSQPSRR
ncbi:hypothetical protein HZS_7219 [Henneguya salminicola]|nr:hypothetical protein HZS_7219 [Henneguya salminicola]